ncbi:uncharacterized protein LOC143194009 [Rhynchophorus ferrugineus]|uniref:uncharacterized protein LOC143194009 n=1 Tax=Rhynchophorus ferrugineus TaxID=354439 RepID=UPI003FCD1FE7
MLLKGISNHSVTEYRLVQMCNHRLPKPRHQNYYPTISNIKISRADLHYLFCHLLNMANRLGRIWGRLDIILYSKIYTGSKGTNSGTKSTSTNASIKRKRYIRLREDTAT